MQRELELELTDKVLALVAARASDLAPSIYENPVEVYTSDKRLLLEQERLFRAMPITAGLSCELREPGQWKTIDLVGVPLVIMRDRDGGIGAFLNVCRHRGMKVAQGRGCDKWLSCPYHAWSYDNQGRLRGVPNQDHGFDDLDRDDRGLVPVPVAERDGLIWVIADKDAGPIDLDAYLGAELSAELATWEIGDWHFHESRTHRSPVNWKLATETFAENYHIKTLHPTTVGPFLKNHGAHHRSYGDHQRLVYPGESLALCEGVPREDWQPFATIGIQMLYLIFPGTLLLMFGDHFEAFQVFPGAAPNESITIQSFFTAAAVTDETLRAELSQRCEMIYTTLATEDYGAAQKITDAFGSGANSTILFGRNEPALQHLHAACNRHVEPGLVTAPGR